MKVSVERRTGRKYVPLEKNFAINLNLRKNERLVNFEAQKESKYSITRSWDESRTTETWHWAAYIEIEIRDA